MNMMKTINELYATEEKKKIKTGIHEPMVQDEKE
jgi:hypothetical protein